MREAISVLISKIGDDGHTIWRPTVLDGLPAEVGARFIRRYESDGTPKGNITCSKTGKPLPGLVGVYGLTVLRAVCDDLRLKYEPCNGRGFEARRATEAISAWLGPIPRTGLSCKEGIQS